VDRRHCPSFEHSVLIHPFLASPGIESLTYRFPREWDEANLLFFHGILQTYNAPTKFVNLRGSFYFPLGVIRLLHGTPNVALNIDYPLLEDDNRFASLSLALSTCSGIPSLAMRIPEYRLSFWDDPAGTGYGKYHFAKLQQLEIDGGTPRDFLLEQLECPSLTDLTLTLDSKPKIGRSKVFSSAATFMQLEYLSIAFKEPPLLSLDDLQPILNSLSAFVS
jgi:hypothetical protein